MKTFWKIYAVVYVLLAGTAVLDAISGQNYNAIDYIDVAISLPTVILVIAWAWRKTLLSRTVWLVYVLAFILFDTTYNLFLNDNVQTSSQDNSFAIWLVGLLLLLPSYGALILYIVNFKLLKGEPNLHPGIPAGYTASTMATAVNHQTATIETWNQSPQSAHDPQLHDIQQHQAQASAMKAMGNSMAAQVRAIHDEKIEADQLGKWPWERWYSHGVVGRDWEKGLADIIFLSFFGSSSATDKKRSRDQRALIRVILTVIIVAIIGKLIDFLVSA